MTKKEQLLEMESCFWKTVALQHLTQEEIDKYTDTLEKEKTKLLLNIFN